MLGNRGVPAIAAGTHMSGNALALAEQLDGGGGDAGLDLLAREAPGHRVVVAVDLDMIVEPGAPHAPFGIDISRRRQRPCRTVDLLEQLTPCAPDPAQNPAVIEIGEQLADRRVDLGKTMEHPVPQTTQQPPLDNPHSGLKLALSRGRRGRVGNTELP